MRRTATCQVKVEIGTRAGRAVWPIFLSGDAGCEGMSEVGGGLCEVCWRWDERCFVLCWVGCRGFFTLLLLDMCSMIMTRWKRHSSFFASDEAAPLAGMID